MRTYNFIIPGRPITKKNSQIIITTKIGQHFLIPKKIYREYEKAGIEELKKQLPSDFKIIQSKVHIQALYWMPNRRGWPDLLGVEESTGDILQKARIITNDKNIISWDGSRLVGIDPKNPRVEILIKVNKVNTIKKGSEGG